MEDMFFWSCAWCVVWTLGAFVEAVLEDDDAGRESAEVRAAPPVSSRPTLSLPLSTAKRPQRVFPSCAAGAGDPVCSALP